MQTSLNHSEDLATITCGQQILIDIFPADYFKAHFPMMFLSNILISYLYVFWITYQWTNARFWNIRSNFVPSLFHASTIAVVFESMHRARLSSAMSLPFTIDGGLVLIPILNPVGHQSTKLIVFLVLVEATASVTSFGITSPRLIVFKDILM